MRLLRRPTVVLSLLSILLWGGATTQSSLLAGGGAPVGPPARDGHPGPPDPCELALTPEGQANGLHRRCESGTAEGARDGSLEGRGLPALRAVRHGANVAQRAASRAHNHHGRRESDTFR